MPEGIQPESEGPKPPQGEIPPKRPTLRAEEKPIHIRIAGFGDFFLNPEDPPKENGEVTS